MSNINSSLESDLKEFCITRDSKLFQNKLYNPLRYLASSICSKQKVNNRELIDGIVADLVSECSIKLPETYDPDKGSAKVMAYVIMNQYLGQKRQFNNKQKRSVKNTFYIEDMKISDKYPTSIIQITVDETYDVEEMKDILIKNEHLFKEIDNKLNRKIAFSIIDCIKDPKKYKSNLNSYTVDIKNKCKCSISDVYFTIKIMKNIMKTCENIHY